MKKESYIGKILVACEYSGIVRDAFSKAGWDAWSCDILPTESELTKSENKHIQGDVLNVLNDGWDLMIAHPPCTYISYAATHIWNEKGRVFKRLDSLYFFAKLWETDIPHICIENPRSCASPVIAKYSQEIQPYYFGECEMKTTWIWLKNLPLLKYSMTDSIFEKITATNNPQPKQVQIRKNTGKAKNRYFCDSLYDNKINTGHRRSKFWNGIANAMAEQWTEYYLTHKLQNYERKTVTARKFRTS